MQRRATVAPCEKMTKNLMGYERRQLLIECLPIVHSFTGEAAVFRDQAMLTPWSHSENFEDVTKRGRSQPSSNVSGATEPKGSLPTLSVVE